MIARALGLSRWAVRRYVEEYKSAAGQLPEEMGQKVSEELIDAIISAPAYDSSGRERRKLTDEMAEKINAYLKDNERKKSSGLHKQLMKAIDVYEALKEDGYDIGYTTVCNYIRLHQKKRPEAFIRQLYLPGEVCEFDWGEVKLQIADQWRKYNLAVFTSAYSNYRWACLFHRQDSSSFQQAHVDFFTSTQGVFRTLVYDNMRVAISKFVGHHEKQASEALLKMSSYYKFGFRFCNIRKGNEKGHVERSVEYIRRKAFARKDSFSSIGQANEWLDSCCHKLNQQAPIQDRYKEESAYLQAAPPGFDCSAVHVLRVDKYSTISYSGNRYSVPDHLVGKQLMVKIYTDKIICYTQEKDKVATHNRSYQALSWIIELNHYLSTFKKKPGALASSVALDRAQEGLKRIYEQHYQQQAKDFIDLLFYIQEGQIQLKRVEKGIEQLIALGCRQITTDKIKTLCEQKPSSGPLKPADDDISKHSQAQLALLSSLMPNHESMQKGAVQ